MRKQQTITRWIFDYVTAQQAGCTDIQRYVMKCQSAVILISPKGRRQRGIDHPNVYQIVPSLLDGLDGPNDALTQKTRMDIFFVRQPLCKTYHSEF